MSLLDSESRRRVTNAMVGGFVGMAVMSLTFALLEVQTRDEIGIFAGIARFVMLPGELLLGFVVFALFGIVVWPLVFVALEDHIPRGPDPAKRGMVFATVLWILFVLTALGEISGVELLIYGSLTLVVHLAYGFILGAVYGYLRTDFSVSELREPRNVEE